MSNEVTKQLPTAEKSVGVSACPQPKRVPETLDIVDTTEQVRSVIACAKKEWAFMEARSRQLGKTALPILRAIRCPRCNKPVRVTSDVWPGGNYVHYQVECLDAKCQSGMVVLSVGSFYM